MRKTNFIINLFVIICIYAISFAQTQNEQTNPKRKFSKDKNVYYERMVGKGVKHIYEFIKDKPYQINVLEIELNQPPIVIEAEKGKDKLFAGETVASIAERETSDKHIVVGAVNADFWGKNYIAIGFFVDDDTIYKNPHPNRACFFMDCDGKPYIDYMQFELSIASDEYTMQIDTINADSLEEGDAILFTPRGFTSTPADKQRFEVVLKQISEKFIPNQECMVKVIEVKENSSGTPINDGTFVLSVSEKKIAEIKKVLNKKELVLKPSVKNFQKPIALAVGGGPMLIKDGKINIPNDREEIRKNFVTDLHPRTALGFNLEKNKLWLFTVDGRQPSLSIGMDLYTVAEYLQKLGATEAMNLDGGGSTTMWVRGNVVNSPSDATGPRTVTNALLVVSAAAKGGLSAIEIEPSQCVLPENGEIKFNIFGYDEYMNPVDTDSNFVSFSISPNLKGKMNKYGLFQAGESSEGTIMASVKNGVTKTNFAHIKVVPVEAIKTSVEKVILESNDEKNVSIDLLGEKGEEILFSPSVLSIKQSGENFSYKLDGNKISIKALNKGKGEINIKSEKAEVLLPVYVDMLKRVAIEKFEPTEINQNKIIITGNNYNKEKTKILSEVGNKKEGEGSLRLDYDMTSGGTTAIYMNINAEITGEPTKISLWVYGDGGKGWLRSEVTDKDGESFIVDFTSGGKGILWKDEWKNLVVPIEEITAKWTNPAAKLDYPIKIVNIYLAQGKEADKCSGTILFDNLEAVIPEF